ncbi:MAG TPA: hypothetical protein VKD69_23880 [Vicinamibacterales bacterium]|nr:hypothetical protein [Vicinamibacterales bacterium]
MKAALTAACVLVLFSVAYLSLSLLVLGPPGANLAGWFPLAAVIAAMSALTLLAAHSPKAPASLHHFVMGGAVLLVAIAVWRVRATLASSHFEGYNLLLGAMLIAQAALTLLTWGRTYSSRLAR